MKNNKFIWIIIAVVVVVVIVVAIKSPRPAANNSFTVGAVLPLTGPAALWGETVKNGMELALEQKTGINVLYQDSKSTAADGISAYNLLQNKGVDLTVSELSIVSVPLSKIALERKAPLLVSLVAATHSSIVNDYTTRYYTDPTNYASPAFTDPTSPVISSKKIALLYRNDELGNSVKDKIQELSDQNGKKIVSMESFMPAQTDYNTAMLKVKNSGADVFIFVASTPGEALGIVKSASQLNIGMPIVESSAVFADLNTRSQAGSIPFYSTSYDFSLPDKAVDFKTSYQAKFGKAPNFGSAFGYDMVNLIDTCKNKKEAVQECLAGVKQNVGVAGTANQVAPGDFVVSLHLEKVN
ncbi:MAG: ABC transporter substrate-binding protein [Candidatus Taylorbacteria bacterium]